MKKINLFEAFAGIWSQHQALKNLWYNVNILWISDWYIDAIIAYWIGHLNIRPKNIDRKKVINFLKKYNLSRDSKKPLKSFSWITDEQLSIIEQVIKKFGEMDITKIKWNYFLNKPRVDIFTYSFPCQDISNQWKKCWFWKWCNTRSWLLWEIERILKEIKELDKDKLPKMLVMENVKAILNWNFKNDLNQWISELEKLWYYSTEPFIVNASDLWEPQKRERVFMVSSYWKKISNFELNYKPEKYKRIIDIFDFSCNREEFKIQDNVKLIKKKDKMYLDGYSNFNTENYVYYIDWVAPTITASWALSRIKVLWNDGKIYLLNWKEHLLLQWFTKDFYEKISKFVLNDTKIKFLAWNSINVKMLEVIFKYYLSFI